MVGADLGAAHAVDLQLGDVANSGRAGDEFADMGEHVAGAFLHVVDAEAGAVGEEDFALVARLSAGLRVEGRLVEYEFGLVALIEGIHTLAADQRGDEAARGFLGFIALEVGGAGSVAHREPDLACALAGCEFRMLLAA